MRMDKVTFFPSSLRGTVPIPPSKSAFHRAILCAALSRGRCVISPVAESDDLRATVRCVCALGARAEWADDALIVDGAGFGRVSGAQLDCGESGSTLRFLIPICAALGIPAGFCGHGRLVSRPLGCYEECLPANGVDCRSEEGHLPFSVSGRLRGGIYSLPGNVSSQFITGLLFALPLLERDSEIRLTTALESAGYVAMTVRMLRESGVQIGETGSGWKISGRQRFQPRSITVESDWSQAAFFLAAGALNGSLRLTGLQKNSLQGDRLCLRLFKMMGARVNWDKNALLVSSGSLRAFSVSAAQIPDLVPVLAMTAPFCMGETKITDAARLRLKESDRLSSTAAVLRALNGSVTEQADGLCIVGRPLSGGECDGANDHRIVMAASVAALCCTGSVTVTDAWSIRKSYPDYFDEYRRLGGIAHVVHVGE